MNEEKQKKFLKIGEAIQALGGYGNFYNEEIRRKHPNGVKRLKHLVSNGVAPDQAALARMLAEFALHNRKSDFEDETYKVVYDRFYRGIESKAAMIELVKEARGQSENKQREWESRKDWKTRAGWETMIAWKACALFDDDQWRVYINDNLEKRIAPIPEPINDLMKDCFKGKIEFPKNTKTGHDKYATELKRDAIRFAIWMALEADITATSADKKKITATSIVASLTGHSVVGIWKDREIKHYRDA